MSNNGGVGRRKSSMVTERFLTGIQWFIGWIIVSVVFMAILAWIVLFTVWLARIVLG